MFLNFILTTLHLFVLEMVRTVTRPRPKALVPDHTGRKSSRSHHAHRSADHLCRPTQGLSQTEADRECEQHEEAEVRRCRAADPQ